MAIMCVGCGAMIERDDISGHFVPPNGGMGYPMCPACASHYSTAQVTAPMQPPDVKLFKSTNQLKAEAAAKLPQPKSAKPAAMPPPKGPSPTPTSLRRR
jgi:hypothetical protein